MSNIYGRQVVEPLVNKSGGGVIAGDVVIVDTSNNGAFTTSTSGAFTGLIGIAQETIASNATGRVLTAGYAALVNVNASVTRGNFAKSHTVAKQATDAGSSRVAGAFAQFLTGGTTPTAHVFGIADNTSGAGTGTLTTVKDEGTNLSTAVASVDFVGAGVTATGTTAVTVTIPGGGGDVQLSRVTRTAGNLSTASTSFVDLTGASITITTGAKRCRIEFTATGFNTNSAIVGVDLNIDGSRVGQTHGLIFGSAANVEHNLSFVFTTDVLSAGSHTFKIQWRVNAGTGFIYASTAESPYFFTVIETGMAV